MKPGGPWSVKGIEPEVRETAKSAARRAGKTLGEWLNQVIMDSGQAPDPTAILRDPALWENAENPAPWSSAIGDLAGRFEASERRHHQLLQNIDVAIGSLAKKINEPTRTPDNGSSGSDRGITERLSKRLETLEVKSKSALSKENLRSVEDAMVSVATILENNEQRQEEKIQAVDASLAALRDRLTSTEVQLTSALALLDSEEGNQAAQVAHNEILTGIAEDMASLDHRLHETHERSESALESVHSNIADIVNRLDSSGSRIDAALTAPLEQAQSAVNEISSRVEASEQAQTVRVDELEKSVVDLTSQLTEARTEQQDAFENINASLSKMTGRLQSLEVPSSPMPSEVVVDDVDNQVDDQPSEQILAQDLEDVEDKNESEAIAENLADDEPAADFDPLEFERILNGEDRAAASPQAEEPAPTITPIEDPEPSGGEAKLGWAARAFRKTTPVEEDAFFEPGPEDDTSLDSSGEETDSESEPGVEETMTPPTKAQEPSPVTQARPEGKIGAHRRRKSVDDYFHEDKGISHGEVPDLPDAKAAREAASLTEDEASETLNDLRSKFISQATEEEDNFRGSLRELVTPEAVTSNRRTIFWIAGTLLVALMVVIGALVLSGGTKDLMQIGDRPSLVNNAKAFVNQFFEDSNASVVQEPVQLTEPPEILSTDPLNEPLNEAVPDDASASLSPAALDDPTNYYQTASLDTSAGLLEKAESGDPKAQYALALAFANGTVVSQSHEMAASWYRTAAEQGLAAAQYRLASRLEQGIGAPVNKEEAITWYIKAANGGNRKAMHNLAVAYAQGNGVVQDLTLSVTWFEKAAQYGLTDAQFNLGLLYQRGLGVEVNEVEAYKWFSVAEHNGDASAPDYISQLAPRLTQRELDYVELYVETWQAKPINPISNGLFDISPEAYADDTRRVIISHVQTMLEKLGYPLAANDGVIDPTTEAAVRQYQALSEMPVTGRISEDLVMILESRVY